MSKNQIEVLPSEISELTSLAELTLDENHLSSIPGTINGLASLRVFRASNNHISSLPDAFFDLTNLEELSISHNDLESLGDSLGLLRRLRDLKLASNHLRRLPRSIGQLSRLSWLDISDNNLERLPEEITKLTDLSYFCCSNNKLTRFLPVFGDLRKLVHLKIDNNAIAKLPDDIGKLKDLQILRAEKNRIISLPADITTLTKLTDVSLYEGQPGPMPIANLVKQWDVFISHATEDKEDIVVPLAEQLRRGGLRVWLDVAEMRLGDSIRSKIDEGLSNSRFGIVVLSPKFLSKKWPARELNALFAIEQEGQHAMLPIWHNLSHADVARFSPMLADRLAVNTSEGVETVAVKIIDSVFYAARNTPAVVFPTVTRRFVELIDSNPSAVLMTQFLFEHHAIVAAAMGHSDRAPGIEIVDNLPGLLVKRPAYSLNAMLCAFVVPGSTSVNLFDESLNTSPEVAERVKATAAELKKVERNKLSTLISRASVRREHLTPVWEGTTVVAGRRVMLTDGEKDQLRALNEGSKSAVRIRTYDWLIDAVTTIDETTVLRSVRPRFW